MSPKQVVNSDKGLQSPLLSQAIVHNGVVYVSGNVGRDNVANKMVEGSTYDRSVQALKNIDIVLQEAGSSLSNLVKVTHHPTTPHMSLSDLFKRSTSTSQAWKTMPPSTKPVRHVPPSPLHSTD